MDQKDINNAIGEYLENSDARPWLDILEGIADGTIIAIPSAGMLKIKAVARRGTVLFGERLTELQGQSSLTYQQLADLLDCSLSSITRQLGGVALGAWPSVVMMIEAMGADPADYRHNYEAAKAEYKSPRTPRPRKITKA